MPTAISSDNCAKKRRAQRSTARADLQRVVRESNALGDAKVRFLEFEAQNIEAQNIEANGSESAWHPNVKTNQIMAEKLLAALQTDLGWPAKPTATNATL